MDTLNNIYEKKEQNLFEKLPFDVQAQIKRLLEKDDFRAAKKVYDEALKERSNIHLSD